MSERPRQFASSGICSVPYRKKKWTTHGLTKNSDADLNQKIANVAESFCKGIIARMDCLSTIGNLLAGLVCLTSCSLIWSISACADTDRKLLPVTSLQDPQNEVSVQSLINVFRMTKADGSKELATSVSNSEVNFYFASGINFIIGNRVQRDALSIFTDLAQTHISTMPTNTDSCYIQDFVFDGTRNITVVVHYETNALQKDVLKCLVAGLWWFSERSLSQFDESNWRSSYIDLLEK